MGIWRDRRRIFYVLFVGALGRGFAPILQGLWIWWEGLFLLGCDTCVMICMFLDLVGLCVFILGLGRLQSTTGSHLNDFHCEKSTMLAIFFSSRIVFATSMVVQSVSYIVTFDTLLTAYRNYNVRRIIQPFWQPTQALLCYAKTPFLTSPAYITLLVPGGTDKDPSNQSMGSTLWRSGTRTMSTGFRPGR